MTSDDAEAVGSQIDDAREIAAGHSYVAPFIANLPRQANEIDAAHRAALERNAIDWGDNLSQQRINEYLINRAFGMHRREIVQRQADFEHQLKDWLDTHRPGDSPWPPPRLWAQIDPEQREQLYQQMRLNTGVDAELESQPVSAQDEVDQPHGGLEAEVQQSTNGGRDPNLILVGTGRPPPEDEQLRRWQRRPSTRPGSESFQPKEILPLLGPSGGGARLPRQSRGPSAPKVRETKDDNINPGEPAIGVGKYAGESIPARSPMRDFNDEERAQINRFGADTGCHTCGTKTPETPLGNFIPDHQPPSRLISPGQAQRLFPHCLACSLRQGGLITQKLRREKK